tara:strand:- start:582 stop:821 length:240 start_codon:yes stop_codon:yes gene_type:complete
MTKKQAELFQYIKNYISVRGYSPSYENMMQGVHLKSKSGVHRLVHALVKQNKIKQLPFTARSIEIMTGLSKLEKLLNDG